MYKLQSKQPGIFDFGMPSGFGLDPHNRWVKQAEEIPWETLEPLYAELFNESINGNVAKPFRLALGAILIQTTLRCSDEATVLHIQETPGMQYLCGFSFYQEARPFHPSLMVHFRKRLTNEILISINEIIIAAATQKIEAKKLSDTSSTKKNTPTSKQITQSESPNDISESPDAPKEANQGTMMLDASCAPQYIRYPTDLGLLNESREKLESMIDLLHDVKDGKKPRTYRKKARQVYLNIVRKKVKTRNAIRVGIGKQLRFIRRNLKIIKTYFASGRLLPLKHFKLYQIICKIYEQQTEMYINRKHKVADRIVSIGQYWVRPIVRGKVRAKVEFGAKFTISVVDGFTRIERTSFNAYNECEDLIPATEKYFERYGHYPAKILADQIFRNQANLKYCRDKNIKMIGLPLGRPKKDFVFDKKENRKNEIERIEVERKLSHSKGSFGLGLIKTKLITTSKTSIVLSILALNIAYIVRVFCFLFFQLVKCFEKQEFFPDTEKLTYQII